MKIRATAYFKDSELENISVDFIHDMEEGQIYSIHDFLDIFRTIIDRDKQMLSLPKVNKPYIKENIITLEKKKRAMEKLFMKYNIENVIREGE